MKTRVVFPLLALVVVGCATATDEAQRSSTTTLERPISTTLSTTTTQATTTTSLATPTTSAATTTTFFPPSDFDCPPVLVTAQQTIVIDVDCGLTVAMTVPGQPVMDDLSGGLLYQTDLSSIWWLASDSSQPVELVGSAENETVELQDVTVANGITEIWFTRTSGTTIEDARQDLAHVNLGGGPQVVVDEVGGWESSSRVTVGGDVIALQSWAEGFYAFGVQHKDGGEMAQPWNPYRAIFEPTIGCDGCPTDLIVTDDGVLAAYLQPLGSYPDIVPSLVEVDVATGQTVHQIELAGLGWQFNEPGPWITEIDMLGDVALLNVGDGEGRHFAALWTDLSRAEPAWSELPVLGRARLLRSDVQFDASEPG